MSDKSRCRVVIIRARQFGTALLMFLCPMTGRAQSDVLAIFKPTVEQKLDARSAPAKVTAEEGNALSSKGYVMIGTISASLPGDKTSAEVTQRLDTAIVGKAAEAGGDVVRFDRDGAVDTTSVPTGRMKKKCEEKEEKSVQTGTETTWCSSKSGLGNSICGTKPKYRTWFECVKWGEEPEMAKVKGLVSEGTVWRYDPKLTADIVDAEHRAEDAKHKAEIADRLRPCPAPDYSVSSNGLWGAVRWEDVKLVEASLQAGAPINGFDHDWSFKYPTALSLAAERGNVAIAKVLLDHGAEVNAANNDSEHPYTPILEALGSDVSLGCKSPMVRFLFEHGAIVDVGGEVTFSKHGEIGLVSDLLAAHVADINRQDKNGQTGLMHAAFRCDESAVKMLLGWGADKGMKDKEGRTAADLAKDATKRSKKGTSSPCYSYNHHKKDFDAFLTLLN